MISNETYCVDRKPCLILRQPTCDISNSCSFNSMAIFSLLFIVERFIVVNKSITIDYNFVSCIRIYDRIKRCKIAAFQFCQTFTAEFAIVLLLLCVFVRPNSIHTNSLHIKHNYRTYTHDFPKQNWIWNPCLFKFKLSINKRTVYLVIKFLYFLVSVCVFGTLIRHTVSKLC